MTKVSALSTLAAVLISAPALAVTTTVWNFNNSSSAGTNIQGGNDFGNFIQWTQQDAEVDLPLTLTVSAWSETVNSSTYCTNNPSAPECTSSTDAGTDNGTDRDPFIDEARLNYYGNGSNTGVFAQNLGITNKDGESGSPQHSVDNIPNGSWGYNDYDMVLLEFSTLVELSDLFVGWTDNNPVDISVLAFTNLDNSSNPPPFSTTDTWGDLLSQGWDVVGNYTTSSNTQLAINAQAIESNYFLVGAYNPIFNLTNDQSFTNANDGFKLAGVGSKYPIPTTEVPEPGTLLLLGLGIWAVRRHRQVF